MNGDIEFLFLYGAVKFFAYTGWCYLAIKWYATEIKNKILVASRFGFIRLLIGIVIGSTVAVWSWNTMMFAYFDTSGYFKQILSNMNIDMLPYFQPNVFAYVAIYPLVRIVEWTLMWFIMKYSLKNRWQAPRKISVVFWVFGGIIVSCMADFPVLLKGIDIRLFSGRPFC